MKFALLFLISFSVFAHEECANCEAHLREDSSTQNLEEFSDKLEHWSANESQVMNAPCKHKTFNTDEMNTELSSLYGKKDKKIGGIQLKDENPELLKVFKRLTTKNKLNWFERLFQRSAEPEFNFQANFSVNPECTKVLCAVDKIWGQFAGRKLLYMNLKFGYNGSEYLRENSGRFNESELDDILMSLSDLPRAIMPMYTDRRLRKSTVQSEKTVGNSIVWADSDITIYPPWIQGPQGLRFQTLVHEVGHNLHQKLPDEKFKEWMAISSWVKEGDNWNYDILGACMPSKYGMTSALEDFAETASAYRYNARALLARCPAKYNFMRDNVFRGVEYREESQCSGR